MEGAPRIELKLLRTILAVARHQSYTRAAEELALTQPAVSMHVRRLEAALGVALVELIGHRARLTAAGELLAREGTRLLADAHHLESQLEQLARGGSGRLRVGASSTPGTYLLPLVLARLLSVMPKLEVSCTLDRTLPIEEMLLEGALDCALVGGHLASRDLTREDWVADEVVLVAGRTHPLAARAGGQPLTRRELESTPWVFHSAGSATRQCLEAWLATKQVEPRIAMELSSVEAVKGMVAAGMGIAGVSRFALAPGSALVTLPAAGTTLRRNLAILYHPAKSRCPMVKSFREAAHHLAPTLKATRGN